VARHLGSHGGASPGGFVIIRDQKDLVPWCQPADQFPHEHFRSAVLLNGIFQALRNSHAGGGGRSNDMACGYEKARLKAREGQSSVPWRMELEGVLPNQLERDAPTSRQRLARPLTEEKPQSQSLPMFSAMDWLTSHATSVRRAPSVTDATADCKQFTQDEQVAHAHRRGDTSRGQFPESVLV